MSDLCLRNRQRVRAINLPLLRRVVTNLLEERLPKTQFELGIYFVGAAEMARINETFLNHSGATDVITFPYSDFRRDDLLQGEIFVCVEEATRQARPFRAAWQSEVLRYVVHGLLHLEGYDDLEPAARRIMKREENRIVRTLRERFSLEELGCARVKK